MQQEHRAFRVDHQYIDPPVVVIVADRTAQEVTLEDVQPGGVGDVGEMAPAVAPVESEARTDAAEVRSLNSGLFLPSGCLVSVKL